VIHPWFAPSASVVAGPNHTATLTASLTNVDTTLAHAGTVTVTLANVMQQKDRAITVTLKPGAT
jgi:hypothetical protein